jgi:hypothetical protein
MDSRWVRPNRIRIGAINWPEMVGFDVNNVVADWRTGSEL